MNSNKEKTMGATISHKTKAWIVEGSSIGPADLRCPKTLERLSYYAGDMTRHGWTCAGEVKITLRLVDEKTLVANKVAALKEELKTVRADAQLKANQIESQIQNLLAIDYDAREA